MPLTIYKSSAGSGKTFTLVKEYLKIVLQDPNEYKHILAITFTNKATEEMKTRIVKDLTDLAKGKVTDMQKGLKEELKMSEQEIKKNAFLTLQRILHNYARFEVRTIDSFFTRIVRSFAKELNLPLRYNIDLDQNKALEEAMTLFYNDIHNNPAIEKWLEAFTEKQLSEDKNWRTDYAIREMGKELFKEKFYQFGENESLKNLKELQKDIKKMQNFNFSLDKKMRAFANKAKALLRKKQLNSGDLKRGTFSYFDTKIADKKYDDRSQAFISIVEGEGTWYAKSKPAAVIADIEEISGKLTDLARATVDYFDDNKREYFNNKAILKNIYAYGVLSQLAKALKEYRDNENVLLLSDTNALMRSAIKDQDAPFLLEKVGSKYKHILIDEFQDTSNFQWHNIRPLVRNSLGEDQRVLIVGDVKQSLYRWRGGNMKLLLEGVEKDLDVWSTTTKVEVLGNNYRSLGNIVKFNNAFFEQSKKMIAEESQGVEEGEASLIEQSYENFAQNPIKADGGYVQIQFFEKIKATEAEAEETVVEQITNSVAEIIEKIRTDGYDLGDVLILVRTHDESGLLAETLTKKDIPFVTEQSLLLKNSPVIRLILSILQYLKNEFDPISQSTLLYRYSKFIGKEIEDFHEVFHKAEEGEINQVLKETLPTQFMEKIYHIRRKPLVEIVEDLLYIFELNNAPDLYLQSLQDVCLDISVKGIIGVSDFFEWWEEKSGKLSIKSSAGLNAVNIMTIHKAKGLEKPVVLVPFVNYSLTPKANETIWVEDLEEPYAHFGLLPIKISKNLLETDFAKAYEQEVNEVLVDTLNLAYVAFTRPKDRLYVLTNFPSRITPLNNINKLMWRVLEEGGEFFQSAWSKDEMVLRVGIEERKAHKNQAEMEEEAAEKEKMNISWLQNYLNRPYNERVSIRSESDRYFEILDLEKMGKISTGIKIHAVLEQLEKKEELEEVVDQLIRDRVLQDSDRTFIIEKINDLLERDLFKYFFKEDWEVFTERSIFWNGQMYKPDRVITKGNEAIVVDYKKEIRDKKYQNQIRGYGKVLEQLNYSNIRLYLVYVQTGAIDEYILGGDERWKKYQEEFLEFVPEVEQLLEE